jgi:thiol:disulfide interchange protein
MKHFLTAALMGLAVVLSHGQESEKPLRAELVAENNGVAPGNAFTVAVKMIHAEGSHSYWVNPGGPGKPTELKWTLPAGFTAGEPQWPAPHAMEFFGSINYGFEKEAVALVEITPPQDLAVGSTAELKVVVDALVCKNNCRPVKADAALSLTAAADAAPNDASKALFADARSHLPVSIASWSITAASENSAAVLSLTPGEGANADPGKLYFFSRTLEFDTQKPQEWKQEGATWKVTLTTAEEAKLAAGLDGVITAEKGWLKDKPEVHAFDVKVNFGQSVGAAVDNSKSAAASKGGDLSTVTLLFFAFIGGLILNVMPCVFPVIGIKVLGFVQQAGENKRTVVLHGLAYTLGVLVCFWALALLVKVLGLSWGGQLQSAGFVLALCYFFVAFGLNMAGVFEFGTSAVGLANTVQHQSGLGRSFFDGLLATVVATPCSAPFLAPALAWAISLSTAQSLLVFTIIGLGLSTPYLLLSIFPGLVKLLPRPGAWMESFKQGMSFLLIATAGYMLWTLGGLVDEQKHLFIIFGSVLVAFACWVYGRWCLPHKSSTSRLTGTAVTILSVVGALVLGWPPNKSEKKVDWIAWTPGLVADLVDQGEIAYVDFTARWCATCQVNKHVYGDPKVIAAFEKKGIKLVKADWTDNNPEIAKALKALNQEAVPVNVLYSQAGTVLVNNDNLSAQEILDALGKL